MLAGMGSTSEAVDASSAVLFDLDGVLLSTADLHRRAWGDLFTGWFAEHGIGPQYSDADYYGSIDGRPRVDGVAAVLASRGVELPLGSPTDPVDAETVWGLGNRKNAAFEALLDAGPPPPFPDTVGVLLRLLRDGKQLAVVSSSYNARHVLELAGIADAFHVVVDGQVASLAGLKGKPAPDTFEHAAAALRVRPERAVVVEDATFGVAAGKAGGFGLVVGVDRGAGADALLEAGADTVISTLAELVPPHHRWGDA